jgi:putative two-component system response regulator
MCGGGRRTLRAGRSVMERLEQARMEKLEQARILIVDDQRANVLLLNKALSQAGYADLLSTSDPREVESLFSSFRPDIILLDLHMPHLDGFDVMEQIREQIPQGSYFPILVLTADITPEAKKRALTMGAKDFVTKPFDVTEVLLRIRNLLETRSLHVRLKEHNLVLESEVRKRTWELEAAQMEILERLALAAEYRDDDTGEHTQRVGRTAALLARGMGLDAEQVEVIRRAAPLHDVGKIGIPDAILLKPGKLTEEEFVRIKTHANIGASILSGSGFSVLQMAEVIALNHHERWQGGGYNGLVGEDIPLAGLIVSVADVFDALIHERPYKKAWPVPEAIAEIKAQSGRQFCPRVVDAFIEIESKFNLRDLSDERLSLVLEAGQA